MKRRIYMMDICIKSRFVSSGHFLFSVICLFLIHYIWKSSNLFFRLSGMPRIGGGGRLLSTSRRLGKLEILLIYVDYDILPSFLCGYGFPFICLGAHAAWAIYIIYISGFSDDLMEFEFWDPFLIIPRIDPSSNHEYDRIISIISIHHCPSLPKIQI